MTVLTIAKTSFYSSFDDDLFMFEEEWMQYLFLTRIFCGRFNIANSKF
jgi:hypothetical protein